MTARMPSRLHHTAYVSKDLEQTRKFYEDILGLPLVATWCESDDVFGAARTYCHCFFGLEDGSALRAEDARVAVPPCRAERRRRHAGGDRDAPREGRLARARHVRARARLLPIALCEGSERHDHRAHLRRTQGGA